MKLIANLAEIDRKATLQAGISPQELMANAGQQVAQAVLKKMTPDKRGVILCGPGNNGGDGFVCTGRLLDAGFQHVSVVYTGVNYRNESLFHLETLLQRPIALINAQQQENLAVNALESADFVVDALFGSGLSREIGGIEARLIQTLNQRRNQITGSAPWVLAVDLPSGIDGANGQCLGIAVEADATLTLAASKPGLYLYPGKTHVGTVTVADIGISPELIDEDDSTLALLDVNTARLCLPKRPADGHKYTFGHVLVLAGSAAMPGAAILCAEAAMSAGAGLVTLATPQAVLAQCRLMPEVMRHPLPDNNHLSLAGVDVFLEFLAAGKFAAIVIGPGLGRHPATVEAVGHLLTILNQPETSTLPVVLDGDALYALGEQKSALNAQFILTPHVGECSRLLGMDSQGINANLPDAARTAQETYQATIVLKAASTVVAVPASNQISIPANKQNESGLLPDNNPSPRQWISPFGNAGMATAGSGDVLAGIIAAMAAQRYAQGLSVPLAALVGVALHGLAGDAAAAELTPYALHASQITHYLPKAFPVLLQS
jgi:ADP-dependent NAD(P)H-hydrate dehydratase / NAD(P)H-hydrate epimerase